MDGIKEFTVGLFVNLFVPDNTIVCLYKHEKVKDENSSLMLNRYIPLGSWMDWEITMDKDDPRYLDIHKCPYVDNKVKYVKGAMDPSEAEARLDLENILIY